MFFTIKASLREIQTGLVSTSLYSPDDALIVQNIFSYCLFCETYPSIPVVSVINNVSLPTIMLI